MWRCLLDSKASPTEATSPTGGMQCPGCSGQRFQGKPWGQSVVPSQTDPLLRAAKRWQRPLCQPSSPVKRQWASLTGLSCFCIICTSFADNPLRRLRCCHGAARGALQRRYIYGVFAMLWQASSQLAVAVSGACCGRCSMDACRVNGMRMPSMCAGASRWSA